MIVGRCGLLRKCHPSGRVSSPVWGMECLKGKVVCGRRFAAVKTSKHSVRLTISRRCTRHRSSARVFAVFGQSEHRETTSGGSRFVVPPQSCSIYNVVWSVQGPEPSSAPRPPLRALKHRKVLFVIGSPCLVQCLSAAAYHRVRSGQGCDCWSVWFAPDFTSSRFKRKGCVRTAFCGCGNIENTMSNRQIRGGAQDSVPPLVLLLFSGGSHTVQ